MYGQIQFPSDPRRADDGCGPRHIREVLAELLDEFPETFSLFPLSLFPSLHLRSVLRKESPKPSFRPQRSRWRRPAHKEDGDVGALSKGR